MTNADVTCPACGASTPAGAQFCEACGGELGAAAAAPPAPAEPAPSAPGASAAAPTAGASSPPPAAATATSAETPAPPVSEPTVVPAEVGVAPAGDPAAGPSPAAAGQPTPAGAEPAPAGAEPAPAGADAPPEAPPGSDPVSRSDPTLEGEPPHNPHSSGLAPGEGPGPGGPAPVSTRNLDPSELPTKQASATPLPPVAGEESPLDVGWTGVVTGRVSAYEQQPAAAMCSSCGAGTYLDGYCDHCGSKEPNPRDHFEESPAAWVGGVCDIGKRHATNEDAMALSADAEPGSRAVLVVCDGVSNTTQSHIASMNGAKAARGILDKPVSAGVGTAETAQAAAFKRLGEAVAAANQAVIATVADRSDPAPPSCTFTGAIVAGATAYVGNVGDSRIYWLPDGGEGAEQLSRDDSFAADRIAAGVERKVAETGPMAHSITRWLGVDAPEDLTPHTRTLTADRPGWLLLCSDGLWNYCSEASDLQALIGTLTGEGKASTPTALASALVDFANNAGGADNITVALARLADATVDGKEESRG